MRIVDSSLTRRLEQLEADLDREASQVCRPPRFVRVSNMPYAIFHYDPRDERMLRRELNKLATRLRKQNWRVHFLSLASLLWKAIEACEGLDALFQLEQEEGFGAVQEQVYTYLTEEFWQPLPRLVAESIVQIVQMNTAEPHLNLVFLYRAGAFAPSMYNMSRLVNELATYEVQTPLVLLYPGSREGTFGLRYMDLPGRAALGNYRVQIY